MYCGDETAGLVGDFGTNSFKIGFAGEDTPRRDIPSVVGYCRAQKSETLDEKNEATPQNSNGTDNGVKPSTTETPNVESKTSNVSPTLTPKKKPDPKVVFDFMSLKASCRETEIARPMRNGMYEKFDLIESMWEHAITHELSCKPEEHPLLICDPSFNTLQNREKLLETMFEKLRSPLLYVAPNAMLSAFSVGRATALVVDVGASGTCVVPVNDGHLLRRSMKRSRVGGDMIDQHLTKLLEESVVKKKIRVPSTIVKTRKDGTTQVNDKPSSVLTQIHPSYINWEKQSVVQDFKRSVCRVWADLKFDRTAASAYMEEKYVLPDGTNVSIGADRFVSPEFLVDPNIDAAYFKRFYSKKEWEASSILSKALPFMIRDSIQGSHVDLRKELAQQILLVGGGSLLPGTIERLGKELGEILPPALKSRFLAPGKSQRLYSAWTGGSVLASLGSFQQMWLSKAEYEEHGARSLLLSRCTM